MINETDTDKYRVVDFFEMWYRVTETVPRTLDDFTSDDYVLVGNPIPAMELGADPDYFDMLHFMERLAIGRKPKALDLMLIFNTDMNKTVTDVIVDPNEIYKFETEHTQLDYKKNEPWGFISLNPPLNRFTSKWFRQN